jgi:hypothetical protein
MMYKKKLENQSNVFLPPDFQRPAHERGPLGQRTHCAPGIPLIADGAARRASIGFGCFPRFSEVRRAMEAQERAK